MRRNRSLTIVIKLGTSSICDEKTHEPLLSNLSMIVETACKLKNEGHRVVIVSSGAIGIGLRRLDMEKRPKHLATVQVTPSSVKAKATALAAVGQCRLIALWDLLFKQLKQPIAQILLTRNDIADRTQYRNAINTLTELLSMGVIPIVNENDTISVSEIKFGDNDTLSAITAGMVSADYLFLMTDVDCLYDKNPRQHPDAKPIEVVEDISSLEADVSSAGSALGTGGMATKLVAARLATSAGVTTIITRSSTPGNIVNVVNYLQTLKKLSSAPPSRDPSPRRAITEKMLECAITNTDPGARSDSGASTPSEAESDHIVGKGVTVSVPISLLPTAPLHTRFLPRDKAIRDRHFWLLHGLKPHGTIYIDEGAAAAIGNPNKVSLLPAGVVHVEGTFAQQEAVSIVAVRRKDGDPNYEILGDEIGRCICNYSSIEIKLISGKQSSEIQSLLGYADSEYVAHRNLIVMHESLRE